MPTGIQNWSKTAASNGNTDSSINWLEGQAPSTVNDSARAMMARVAEWRDDLGGITTGGTATAYTITSNRVFTSLALMDKAIITIIPHTTSGAAPTLNVDALGAKQIRRGTGVNVPSGALVVGTPYALIYLNASTEFILLSGTGAISAIDLDGTSSILTAPDTADEALVYDASGAVNTKITLGNLFKVIDTFTAKTAPVLADEVAIYDVAGAAAKKLAFTDLLRIITLLTSKSAPVSSDEIAIYDVSGTAPKKTTIAQIATALPAMTVQYLTSGTSATYTTPANCRAIKVKMIGGGGGGGGTGATAGGTTTFNSINANGGGAGAAGGGSGGTGSASLRLAGGDGNGGYAVTNGLSSSGGVGPFGGAGRGSNDALGGATTAGKANTGAGGGGSRDNSGGGAGEYVEIFISSPSATYTYTVGAGGTAGTGAFNGGNGGSGLIIVEEYY
jgi:hypothetical protein